MNNEQWGNIELPGLDDKTLHSTNWNTRHTKSEKAIIAQATAEQWQDPKVRNKRVKSLKQEASTKEGRARLSRAGSSPKAKDHAENVRKARIGTKRSAETGAKISKAQIGNQKHAKPFHAGKLGVFPSLKLAGEAWHAAGLSSNPVQATKKLRALSKADKDNYYFLGDKK